MSPKIYATSVWITNKKVQTDCIRQHLACNNELVTYFGHIYDIAYHLFYNDFFLKEIKFNYLGHESQNKKGIGLIRLDYVHVENQFLNLNSIHVHINFITANENFTFDEENNPLLDNICGFLKETKSSHHNSKTPFSSLYVIKKLFIEQYSTRKYTYPISKYLYTSICNLEPKQLTKWKDLSRSIWGTLYLHNKGVTNEGAYKKLKNPNWKSTDFFINYFQPGALVSISKPFPNENRIYQRNLAWFSGQQICNTDKPIFKLPERDGWKGEDYDLLPDYPPLKYLGLMPLELSGYVEENLRYIYMM